MNTKQILLMKVARNERSCGFLANMHTARTLGKVARKAAIQSFAEDCILNKKASLGDALNGAWEGVKNWWADDANKAGLVGGGLTALGTYGLTGLVPGLRNNTAARLGISGLAGVGGYYGGQYGANALLDKYRNIGNEAGHAEGYQQGLDQGAKDLEEQRKDYESTVNSLRGDLDASMQNADKIRGDLTAEQNAHKMTQAGLAGANEALAGKVKELGAAQEEADRLRDTIAAHENTIAGNEQTIAGLRGDLDASGKRMSELNAQIAGLTEQSRFLKSQLAEAATAKEQLTAQLTSESDPTARRALASQLNQVNATLAATQTQLGQLQGIAEKYNDPAVQAALAAAAPDYYQRQFDAVVNRARGLGSYGPDTQAELHQQLANAAAGAPGMPLSEGVLKARQAAGNEIDKLVDPTRIGLKSPEATDLRAKIQQQAALIKLMSDNGADASAIAAQQRVYDALLKELSSKTQR